MQGAVPAEGGVTTGGQLDTGLFCLALIMRVLGRPVDLEQLKHRFGHPNGTVTPTELLRAGKALDVKLRKISSSWVRLAATPLPALARCRDGSFILLAGIRKDESGGESVLLAAAPDGRPRVLPRAEFEALWSGELILAATRADLAGPLRRFDVSWFVPAIIKYRRMFGEVLLASFIIQVMALVSPLMFQVVIDKVMVHRSLSTLDVLVFALIVIAVFEAIFGGLRTYLFSHTTNRIDLELGARLFSHIMGLPLAYFGARRVGDSVARVRELENIRNFLTGSTVTVVVDLAFTFVFIFVMFLYSPFLTWITLAAVPFYVGLSVAVTPVLKARLDEKFARGSENQSFLVERISGIETVKAMAVEPQMQRRWEELLAAYVKASFRVGNLANIAGQLAQTINKILMAATLWFGAKLVIGGDLTVGELVAFNMLSGRVSGPILRIAQLWQDFQQARLSIERLGDILNTRTESGVSAGRQSLPPLKGQITFDRVTFRYRPDGPEVLRNLSLDIPPGQVIGIVGPSGSGKSTLTKLVQRLYVPEAGKVAVDGLDLSMVDPTSLRRMIGVVLQENTLFSGTIRENIALTDPGSPLERVIAAAELAGAHEFIMDMQQGYDTIVGERGATLSGGQRQRIAIARALIGNPRVLVFDEATSALDVESEAAIQANMDRICQGRTVLIIAHRLSAVRNANRIITVEQGQIVEDGTPEQLMRQGGRFAAMMRQQVGGLHVV
ncbi:type I secretion system permease/ATPase [Ferrovibrio sp.]|uniref:type I secretion system permease/ATPase n=1 Tax=Ferrovibrio sp. TaxID=1917215 RepID=UPI0035B3B19F